MSSIERAKSFMQRKARLIALTAVPLASLIAITPAKATGVTPLQLDPNGTDTCAVSVVNTFGGVLASGSSCNVGQSCRNKDVWERHRSRLQRARTLELQCRNQRRHHKWRDSISGQVPISWDFVMSDTAGHNLNWTSNLGCHSHRYRHRDGVHRHFFERYTRYDYWQHNVELAAFAPGNRLHPAFFRNRPELKPTGRYYGHHPQWLDGRYRRSHSRRT